MGVANIPRLLLLCTRKFCIWRTSRVNFSMLLELTKLWVQASVWKTHRAGEAVVDVSLFRKSAKSLSGSCFHSGTQNIDRLSLQVNIIKFLPIFPGAHWGGSWSWLGQVVPIRCESKPSEYTLRNIKSCNAVLWHQSTLCSVAWDL